MSALTTTLSVLGVDAGAGDFLGSQEAEAPAQPSRGCGRARVRDVHQGEGGEVKQTNRAS